MAEIEEKKRLKAEENVKSKELLRVPKKNGRENEILDDAPATLEDEKEDLLIDHEDETKYEDDRTDDASNPMAALLASAQARATEHDRAEDEDDMNAVTEYIGESTQVSEGISINYRKLESSRRAFDKIFKKVVDEADVVLEVLDARNPQGTRSQEVERQITSDQYGSKRLIIILNKIDFVPLPVLKGWLTYLRRFFPTIPLRASSPVSKAHTFDHQQLTMRNTSEALLRALKSYAASKQFKRAISVGVIGYPNVGKSSVINALTSHLSRNNHGTACPVGPEAGITTSLREVKVDSKLKVLDSPGIVFPPPIDEDASNDTRRHRTNEEARLTLLNALPIKQISDPTSAVALLISRLSSSPDLYEKLCNTYNIKGLAPFMNASTTNDFLIQVARQRGRMGKGGVPNVNAAAMTVITDWRDGRIQGWADPPALQSVPGAASSRGASATTELSVEGDQIEVVKEWGQEFKLEGLWGNELPED